MAMETDTEPEVDEAQAGEEGWEDNDAMEQSA